MNNQLKHNAANSVRSQYSLIAGLKPEVRRAVNTLFVAPIIEAFFANKGGAENFRELDPDKLLTEVEFNDHNWSFVKEHIYKEVADEISKAASQRIIFKPRYVVCFDEDLTDYKTDISVYPYKSIFELDGKTERRINYGAIRLGEAVILYYIHLELQEIIRFIKTLPKETSIPTTPIKAPISEIDLRKKLINGIISEKQSELSSTRGDNKKRVIHDEIARLETLKNRTLEGDKGRLRVNLMWNSTDDLDLHVITPSGEIFFSNKTVEHLGVIGRLDVDKNAGGDLVSNPQENINFDALPTGKHQAIVKLYKVRDSSAVPFTLSITSDLEGGKVLSAVVIGEKSQLQVSFQYQDGALVIGDLM